MARYTFAQWNAALRVLRTQWGSDRIAAAGVLADTRTAKKHAKANPDHYRNTLQILFVDSRESLSTLPPAMYDELCMEMEIHGVKGN